VPSSQPLSRPRRGWFYGVHKSGGSTYTRRDEKKNIFRNESQKVDAAFIEAGLPERVLLVPLDFAKITHYACFCDGRGTYVRKAFTIKNTQGGIDYLVDQIERTRVVRAIKSKRHVIIGGEDSASYTHNFMDRLFELG